jgi:xanthine dehydrogenase accessory factor
MNSDWLAPLIDQLADGKDIVLVTVARTQGSAPREAGATMIVANESTLLSVGGGHLEWQATAHARRVLDTSGGPPRIVRYSLGARLGQCCGGVVWLLFEHVPAASLPQWRERLAACANGHCLQRHLDETASAARWSTSTAPMAGFGTRLEGDGERWQFTQEIGNPRFPVCLFGAGHVARALVRQLLPLGAAVTWIDTRDDAFIGIDAEIGGLQTLVTDTPESEVAGAPPGSYFVIMTHSHALDFALCEAVFKRRDFAYFGLIGSRSKRVSFTHRLLDRGLPHDRLDEMTCPIGIPGIVGKEPAAIALAVAAEILQIHGTRRLLAEAGRPRVATPTAPPSSGQTYRNSQPE